MSDHQQAVVDRVEATAQGQRIAVLLVGPKAHELLVDADQLGDLAVDGTHLRVTIDANGALLTVAHDPGATVRAKQHQAQRRARRDRIARARPSPRKRRS